MSPRQSGSSKAKQKKIDPMATKIKMGSSLKKLMQDTPFEKITVNDIVNDCGINRQTLYYHFENVHELLRWIFQTEVLEGLDALITYETWPDAYYKLFEYILQNKNFCKNTYQAIGKAKIERFLFKTTSHLIMTVVQELSHDMNVAAKYKKFIVEFYQYALAGLIINWMTRGALENPKDIIAVLCVMVEGEIKQALERFAKL